MYWKVYHIQSGRILKAGFASEDEAKDWLEQKSGELQEDYEVEEMDPDEEEDWRERMEDEEYEEGEITEDEPIGFGDDYFDGTDLNDDEDELTSVEEDDDDY